MRLTGDLECGFLLHPLACFLSRPWIRARQIFASDPRPPSSARSRAAPQHYCPNSRPVLLIHQNHPRRPPSSVGSGSRNIVLNFDVSAEVLLRLSNSVYPMGTYQAAAGYFEGALRYRFRMCAIPISLANSVLEDIWVTTPTNWPDDTSLSPCGSCELASVEISDSRPREGTRVASGNNIFMVP